jgi:hypothetical protein
MGACGWISNAHNVRGQRKGVGITHPKLAVKRGKEPTPQQGRNPKGRAKLVLHSSKQVARRTREGPPMSTARSLAVLTTRRPPLLLLLLSVDPLSLPGTTSFVMRTTETIILFQSPSLVVNDLLPSAFPN